MKYPRFAELMKEGLDYLVLSKRQPKMAVLNALGDELGCSVDTIYAWGRGERLPQVETIEQLAQIFMKLPNLDQRWLQNFLRQAHYPTVEQFMAEHDEEKLSPSVSYTSSSLMERSMIQIYIKEELLADTQERLNKAIKGALAGLLDISPTAIQIYQIREGSVIVDMSLPTTSVATFRSLLENNHAQLHQLKIEQVVLQIEENRGEQWFVHEGRFYHTLVYIQINQIINNYFITVDKEIPQPITFAKLLPEIKLKRQYTPIQQLDLKPETVMLVEDFSFVGIKWWSVFAFTVGFIQADGLNKTEIEDKIDRFIQFNDKLYRDPKGLDISWPVWFVGFTLGGVVCLVFEDGCSEELIDFIDQKRSDSQAYGQGISAMFWVQTKSTSLIWAVDLKAKQLYRHQGKQPDGTNYHARTMVQECEQLEKLINDIL